MCQQEIIPVGCLPPRLSTVSRSIPCIPGGVEGESAQPLLDADPPGHVTCDACWEATSPPDRQTPVKTLPSPKLRLRAVITTIRQTFDVDMKI